MLWLFDIIAFLTCIALASPLTLSKAEEQIATELSEHYRRGRNGWGEAISILALLPILGHLLANHGILFVVAFIFLAFGIAYNLRFLTFRLPAWALIVIALFSFVTVGYSYLWL